MSCVTNFSSFIPSAIFGRREIYQSVQCMSPSMMYTMRVWNRGTVFQFTATLVTEAPCDPMAPRADMKLYVGAMAERTSTRWKYTIDNTGTDVRYIYEISIDARLYFKEVIDVTYINEFKSAFARVDVEFHNVSLRTDNMLTSVWKNGDVDRYCEFSVDIGDTLDEATAFAMRIPKAFVFETSDLKYICISMIDYDRYLLKRFNEFSPLFKAGAPFQTCEDRTVVSAFIWRYLIIGDHRINYDFDMVLSGKAYLLAKKLGYRNDDKCVIEIMDSDDAEADMDADAGTDAGTEADADAETAAETDGDAPVA
jgi:hypothetical protein